MTRRFCAPLFVLTVASFAAFGQDAPNPATKAVSKPDKGWQGRHESFVKRAAKGDVDVLFLGDSITQGWEGGGKAAWKETFEPMKAANFGIGGDRTEHVLWRITEGKELEGINPKVAVLMIGTNNSGSNSPDQIAEGVTAIVKELRKQRPETKVLLLGVFPRAGKSTKESKSVPAMDLQPKIKQINDRIAKLDDGKAVKYLDIGAKFLEKDGSLSREVMPDYLHLSGKGYAIWADAIKGPVADLMKR
ncbi:platelet-activating factor acetylhydrolase IB subunit [Urbifossiella limnaea]|uniref:GDSL-like Lipase/Acylhydrolase n=1 Tax=Urbifossiella limnaea TaxID=2528023 RepID=A0A517XQY7_9BACT|nr:platelet-activating factor acetylhydrolase IB subunit [Urbifossiella limnaea]QDU19940.1 GDSL-like Lipase/Acylhydrolase [Urbifossiella limnaea]